MSQISVDSKLWPSHILKFLFIELENENIVINSFKFHWA
jgi:hypothetical protein